MVYVPYRGLPQALTDLIGGRVQVMFDSLTTSVGYIRAGQLRALAVTTVSRWEGLPDLPTVNDFVPGFEYGAWAGIGAPTGTPPEVIDKLNREINTALADPKIRARFADFGSTVQALSPGEFGKLIAAETEKWAKVIRAANIKAE
jgi:tripartite-type tricarboxylate transporter receptor subunit TctC